MESQPDVNRHYEQLLGLTNSWAVSSVEVRPEVPSVNIRVEWRRGNPVPCPDCGRPCPIQDHREERSWRHLDTMQFETIVTCRAPRSTCGEHGAKTVDVPWAGRGSRFTLLFERFAIDVILASKSLSSAMGLLRISWRQAHAVMGRAVERGLARREEGPLRHVGIDEKSFGRGHSYVSLLTDIGGGRVLDLVPERTEEAATELLGRIPDTQRNAVEAVAMDMWKPFMSSAERVLPGADIVHDRYHAATYLGKAVDMVRRKEHRELSGAGNRVLSGSRYAWLRNPENWSDVQRDAFRALRHADLKTGRAWAVKEAFRKFWSYRSETWALKFFRRWYFWATHSRLKPVVDAAKTLKRHLPGLLAYVRHRITNAATEGLNSKIQSIKANARGYRSFRNYRTAILFHCGKLSLYPQET